MNWRKLNWQQHYGKTSKERIEARKLCDEERGRLSTLDKHNGTKLLLAWTIHINKMPELEKDLIMSDIDNDIAMPTSEAPAKPKRGRKPKAATAAPSQAAVLEAALAFVAPVESDLQDWSQYVSLANNMAVMFNGQMAAGHPIQEALTVNPHLAKLRAALKRCGQTLAITEDLDSLTLAIKGDKLRAIVPCINQLVGMPADPPIVNGQFDILKESFKICGSISNENGATAIEASLLLDSNTCTGTNRQAMLQHWHGLGNLPNGTVIPKVFADAVAKATKPITGLGGHWDGEKLSSLTIWFDGGAWLKTQCYEDRWPDLTPILDIPSVPKPVPNGLFEASEAVAEFLEDTRAVYFTTGFVQSHKEIGKGAQYSVPDLDVDRVYNSELLKKIAPHVQTIDLTTYQDKAMFFGQNIRGAIMGMRD